MRERSWLLAESILFLCASASGACENHATSGNADDAAATPSGGAPNGGTSNGGTSNGGASSANAGVSNAGSGGASANAGSGGIANGESAGTSSGGASGSAGAAAAPFGPIHCLPGTDGDGKHDLAASASDPLEWTLSAGATAGKITPSVSFASTTYNQHFPYWIYTSANYVAGMPAIFLLFGDGNQFLTDFHAATVLDNLIATHALPPTVALFIDPPSDGDRVATYDPPTDEYTNFLFNEILPQVIFGKYSVSRDPEAWSIVGYSASGGQGWEVLWNRPDDFHKFVGDNTSFGAAITYGVDWVKVIAAAPARTLRVSLLTSTNDLSDQRGMWYVINQNVAADLADKGNPWRLMIGTGMHYPPLDGEHDLPNAL
ncbi:MAG TPA: alpha/beta hydrolase-fold protein, partial [Polyangiaceae bacterium]